MNPKRRQVLTGITAGTLAATVPWAARAQAAYPSKPLTIIVPYPPGASSDQTARLVQAKMSETFGQPVIVENRAGANGALGAAYVARMPADGYTVLMATQPIVTINPFLQKDNKFDPLKELAPLTKAADAVVAICVNTALPVNSLAELIAYVKKNPGTLSFGTAGAGTPQHIGGIQLGQQAGIDMPHIPSKGGGPMVNDLIAGHVKVGIATLSVFKPFMNDSRVKVIAVGEPIRYAPYPDIPSVAETLPGFELATWLGFFGPVGMPPQVSAALESALVKALNSPDVKTKLGESALIVKADGAQALAKVVQSDRDAYSKIIREHKITGD
ncbi:tripartite tricarboxylate transporter substrate binding protein [soil metagenome]